MKFDKIKPKGTEPTWWNEKENCLWCHRSSSLDGVEILKNDKSLILTYTCDNDECIYPLSESYTFSLRLQGTGYLERYNEFINGVQIDVPETET